MTVAVKCFRCKADFETEHAYVVGNQCSQCTKADMAVRNYLQTAGVPFRPSEISSLVLGEPEPVPALRHLRQLRWSVEHQLALAVREAAKDGATWTAIADELGTSQQAARERYGR